MTDRISAIAPKFALRIWSVLVEECRARDTEDHRCEFTHYLAKDVWCGHEYRFMGALGFGGKFYNDHYRWRVGCYLEDETPERLEMIDRANARLAELRRERAGGR